MRIGEWEYLRISDVHTMRATLHAKKSTEVPTHKLWRDAHALHTND